MVALAPAVGAISAGSGSAVFDQHIERPTFWELLGRNWSTFVEEAIEHIGLVLASVALAVVIGVTLGILVYRHERAATLALAAVGSILTVPSFALFGLLVPLVGIGWKPAWIALIGYALLPIVRNTVTGLRGIDPEIVESAKGMGMRRRQQLVRIELPLAWPVVLTGIRVSTLVIVSIAAIAALVGGPGLGNSILSGLARIGGAAALPLAIGGTVGVIVVALLLDLLYQAIGALTIPRGVRN